MAASSFTVYQPTASSYSTVAPPPLNDCAPTVFADVADGAIGSELDACRRALLEVRTETLECQAAEEARGKAHEAELEELTTHLDVLDAALVAELGVQAEESREARTLEEATRKEVATMNAEVLFSQAESELAAAEFAEDSRLQITTRGALHTSGRAGFNAASVQTGLLEDQMLEGELASLEFEAVGLKKDLAARRSERQSLQQRCHGLEEALRRAMQQISAYEDWSRGIHNELREVAVELQADRAVDERELQRLRDRAADLECYTGTPGGNQIALATGWMLGADRGTVSRSSSVPTGSPAAVTPWTVVSAAEPAVAADNWYGGRQQPPRGSRWPTSRSNPSTPGYPGTPGAVLPPSFY
eukprot:TRINITY_DN19905_c1_g1_i1.p1 TRINITY_DN19905_c1_g1~~TRINITY_DN19905_c1_g1_i1.p1  ORF type:complete len:359 (-),score=66.48 TRINITY_DN19905_c1_g1_i1:228-1304(-)